MSFITWYMDDPRCTPAHLGAIPFFLTSGDARSAVEQLNEGYARFGGWQHFEGFTYDPEAHTIKYPGDPKLKPMAHCDMPSGEKVFVYPGAWVLVLKTDGTHEINRMD